MRWSWRRDWARQQSWGRRLSLVPPLLKSSDCKQLLSWCRGEAPALFGFSGGERCARKQVEKLLWGQKGGQEQGPAVPGQGRVGFS